MKILFTGGTFAGKTTLINKLSNYLINFEVVGEVAQSNMKLLIEILGKDEYVKWRTDNFLEFQKMNIYSNLKRDLLLQNNKNYLIDRGVFDWIASLKRENISIPKYLEDLVKNISYDIIFFVESLPYHNTRKQTGRLLDKSKSDKWAKFILDEYEFRFGKEKIVKVPFFDKGSEEENIKARIEFVVNRINYFNK